METLENTAKQSRRSDGTALDTANMPAEGVVLPTVLRPKVEHFAQLYAAYGNASKAYREAFDVRPGTRAAITAQRAYELVHEPAVAARVRELLAQAAEGTTISARARMVRLQEIIEADPGELVRVVVLNCPSCWSDLALAAALDRGEVPDTDGPQEDCPACRGRGVQDVRITPTDKLSASARRLLKGIRRKSDGSIEVLMHDAVAASDQLNRMQGAYVERSQSIVAHVHVEPLRDMTPAEIAELFNQQKQL